MRCRLARLRNWYRNRCISSLTTRRLGLVAQLAPQTTVEIDLHDRIGVHGDGEATSKLDHSLQKQKPGQPRNFGGMALFLGGEGSESSECEVSAARNCL